MNTLESPSYPNEPVTEEEIAYLLNHHWDEWLPEELTLRRNAIYQGAVDAKNVPTGPHTRRRSVATNLPEEEKTWTYVTE